MSFETDEALFEVLLNEAGRYSLWPLGKPVPQGWQPAGCSGPKADCVSYVETVWTDLRPRA